MSCKNKDGCNVSSVPLLFVFLLSWWGTWKEPSNRVNLAEIPRHSCTILFNNADHAARYCECGCVCVVHVHVYT